MALRGSFLDSKVARRIFVLFVLCALLPISALALYSFSQVSDQLYEHAAERLRLASRAHGQAIAERLLLIKAELLLLAAQPAGTATELPTGAVEADRFLGFGRLEDGDAIPSSGAVESVPSLSESQLGHLRDGKPVLVTQRRRDQPPLLFMFLAPDPGRVDAGLLVASLNPTFVLLGGEDTLPRNNDLCFFDGRRDTMWCSTGITGALPAAVHENVRTRSSGTFEWDDGRAAHLAGFWSLPLAFQFHETQWTVMVSEPRDVVLAPVAGFRRAFPMIVLMSLWVVVLLSIGQIRRVLVPLERLREGTRKLAARRFDEPVEVHSGDEFEGLADAFNEMADRLGKQFGTLATIAEIDRAILSTLDIDKIVNTALRRLPTLIGCEAASITLLRPDRDRIPRTFYMRSAESAKAAVETVDFSESEVDALRFCTGVVRIETPANLPSYVTPLARVGCEGFIALPMLVAGEPVGAISLGFTTELPDARDEDLQQVRRLADQVAVALSNGQLLEELDALNWGALTALARAVDAKSPWTAGHSERVTAMALRIGQAMRLSSEELETLHRGGLLHDLGKIGVPAAIIDKSGKLADEEYEIMKEHPTTGANILAPIAAFAEVIPIVREHHERWDGKGYPDGIAGEKIHLLARVLAVADAFDAIASDRPYRKGSPPAEVVREVARGDGTQFDPRVVEAFLEVMDADGSAREPAVASAQRPVQTI